MSSPLRRRTTSAPTLVRHLAAAVTVLGVAGVFVATAPAAQAAPGPLVRTGANSGYASGSAGDFNGDGITDTIYTAGGTVRVLYGTTTAPVGIDPWTLDGTRSVSFTVPTSDTLLGAVSAGDVDHDGLGDIAVTTSGTLSYIVYGSRTGAGTTTALAAGPGVTAVTTRPLGSTFGATTLPSQSNPASDTYAIGDFNGDGVDDVQFGGLVGTSLIYGGPRVQTINGTTQSARVSLINDYKSCAVAYIFLKVCTYVQEAGSPIGDFNGDGKADLYVTTVSTSHQILLGSSGSFTLNSGATNASTIALPGLSGQQPSGSSNRIGDVNGDGLADLGYNGTKIMLGRRNPPATIPATDPQITLTSARQGAYTELETVGVGDQNGDGKDDLLAFSRGDVPRLITSIPAAGGTINVDAQPALPGGIAGMDVGYVARTDVDGDGAPDVLVGNETGEPQSTTFFTHKPAPAGGGNAPPPTPASSYPTSLTQDGWNGFMGTATPVGSSLQLTKSANQVNGWAWKDPADYRTKTISFDVTMSGGTGGEGMTIGFVPPAADGTFPLDYSSGVIPGPNTLGFGYFKGLALALDVSKGTGDPNANEVGLTDGGGNDALNWLKVAPSTVPLYGGNVVHVQLVFNATYAAVYLNGKIQRGGGPFAPAASTYLVFTSTTSNAHWQTTTISNLSITDS